MWIRFLWDKKSPALEKDEVITRVTTLIYSLLAQPAFVSASQRFCKVTDALPSQPTNKCAFGVKLGDVFTKRVSCASQLPAALCRGALLLLLPVVAFGKVLVYANYRRGVWICQGEYTHHLRFHNYLPFHTKRTLIFKMHLENIQKYSNIAIIM